MEKERWKDIPGYNGKFKASTFGRIMNVFSEKHKRPTGTILKHIVNRFGYCVITITIKIDGKFKKKTKKVHRLVCLTFHENPENKPQVNHKDLNKQNNHYKNLEWNTQSENMVHAHANGARKPRCHKKVINTATGELLDTKILSEIWGVKTKWVRSVLNGYTKPNTTEYKYA